MSATTEDFKLLKVSDITVWEAANVRHTEITEGLDELAASIREIGLLQPILVKEVEKGKYKVVAGQRRFLAVTEYLRWPQIPALIIKKDLDETEAKLRSISENLHRKAVTAEDYAQACLRLKEKYGDDKVAAKFLGISVQTFRSYLGFAGLPGQIRALVPKVISRSDALRLGALVPNVKKAVTFAYLIAKLPKPARDRYWSALAENPDAPLPAITESAKRAKYKTRFIIHLAETYARGLVRASDEREVEPEYVAEQAVIGWLKQSGYSK